MASVEGTWRARYSNRLPSFAQPLEHGEVVDVELLGEEPGDLGRLVLGHLGVTDQHQPVDGGRERLAVAVEDVAALGGQHDVDGALGGRHRGVGARGRGPGAAPAAPRTARAPSRSARTRRGAAPAASRACCRAGPW